MPHLALLAALAPLAGVQQTADQARSLPEPAQAFLASHCLDCHDAATAKGELVLEGLVLDWADPATAATLERVRRKLATGEMPPPRSPQPEPAEREAQLAWIEAELSEHLPLGGGVPRRLNRFEYEASIHTLFPLRERLPVALPPDQEEHGFDTVAEALVLSPTHMRQYLEAATWVADELIPLARPEPGALELQPGDFAGNKTHRVPLEGGASGRRLVNSIDVIARGAARAERFVAPHDGVYRLALTARAFRPEALLPASDGAVARPTLELRAWLRGRSTLDPLRAERLLGSFELEGDGARELELEAELLAGETLLFQYANAPLFTEDRFVPRAVLRDCNRRAPELLRALAVIGFDRTLLDEENQARLVQHARSGGPPPTPEQRAELRRELDQGHLANEIATVFGLHAKEHGPAIDLLALRVEGPVRPLEALTRWLPHAVEQDGESFGQERPADFARAVLAPLLHRAFRRPVEADELERFVQLSVEHAATAEGGAPRTLRHGLHLALRAILCSPEFLYRDARPGPLDDHGLVARLSYFLWSAPPPPELLDLAERPGELGDPELEQLVRRMVASPRAARFAEHFTGQWLRTRELQGIMPDERLFPVWAEGLYRTLPAEAEAFFLHVLRENLPVDRFLDSDFAFLNEGNAAIYGIEGVEGPELRQVALPPNSPRGGVLGMAAVAMATANGVDTSPVLRGVWVLEALLDERPPPPPDDVPALVPDANGARTVREALAIHRADPACARCHDRIDPLGFALEELDPVGGLRASYPELVHGPDGVPVLAEGPAVDALGVLLDGTRLAGLSGLKHHLLGRRDDFARALATKLLVYATGRAPGPADRRAAEELVAAATPTVVGPSTPGFLDLVVALVKSPAFRVR